MTGVTSQDVERALTLLSNEFLPFSDKFEIFLVVYPARDALRVSFQTLGVDARLVARELGGQADSPWAGHLTTTARRVTPLISHLRQLQLDNAFAPTDSGRLETERELGELLRSQRIAAGLSLTALADRAGVSFGYIGRIERGHHVPAREKFTKLADEVSPDAIARQALLDKRDSTELHDRFDLDGAVADLAVKLNRDDVAVADLAGAIAQLHPSQQQLLVEALTTILEGADAADPQAAEVPRAAETPAG